MILVAHSWGGIPAPEFILRTGNSHVAALVLVDTNQGRTLDVTDWRDPNLEAMSQDLEYSGVLGIRKEHKLTSGEFSPLMHELATPKHILASDRERIEYPPSLPTLAMKNIININPPLLGGIPLCVVIGRSDRDYKRLYEAGVERGNGSEEQRRAMRALVKTWDEKEDALGREQLIYSTNSKVMIARKVGIVDPAGSHCECGEMGAGGIYALSTDIIKLLCRHSCTASVVDCIWPSVIFFNTWLCSICETKLPST